MPSNTRKYITCCYQLGYGCVFYEKYKSWSKRLNWSRSIIAKCARCNFQNLLFLIKNLFIFVYLLQKLESYESIRWPATLGFLTILLLLCTVLVIGVARRSRCSLIFFSVFGLFGVIICWFLAGIYLASSVALGDFCMRPHEFMCRQVGMVIFYFVQNLLSLKDNDNRITFWNSV